MSLRKILFTVVIALRIHDDVALVDASRFFPRRQQRPAPHLPRTDIDPAATSSSTTSSERNLVPERGQLIPDGFHPQDLYKAYAEILRDYEEKAFHRSADWVVLRKDQDVIVSLLQHESDPTCPYVKMQGIIPVPVKDCWEFLRVDDWDRTMPKMDPFYESVSIRGEYVYHAPSHLQPKNSWRNKNVDNVIRMLLCRKRMKRILAFGKRDLVFLSVTEDEPLEDGTWVSGTVSVRTSAIPRQPHYTRAFQDSIAFYKPIRGGTATDLTIVCRIDLNDSGEDGQGGFIPMWLYVKTIGHTATASVNKMRQALIQEAAEKAKESLQAAF